MHLSNGSSEQFGLCFLMIDDERCSGDWRLISCTQTDRIGDGWSTKI